MTTIICKFIGKSVKFQDCIQSIVYVAKETTKMSNFPALD